MKEFIEKLIGALEEELSNANFEKSTKEVNESFYDGLAYAYGYSIGVAMRLAEEHKDDIQTIDVSELLGEQGNDGWIPCSERLPEVDREYNCLIFDDRAKKTFESSILYVKQHGWGVSGSNYVVAYKPYQPKGE